MLTAAIIRHLATRGHGVFDAPGATLFLEELPSDPVNAMSIGFKTAPPSDFSDYPVSGIQVLVRTDGTGGRARSGYDRACAVRDELHGLRHITLDEGGDDEIRLVHCYSETHEPINLGDDANGHPRWSLRLLCTTHHETLLTIS